MCVFGCVCVCVGGGILYLHALKSTFLSLSLFNFHRYEVPMTNPGRLEVSAG